MNQTFSAIVSNNLNNIMKILTSLTIILIHNNNHRKYHGMNIKLPIAERDDAFIWLVLANTIYLYRNYLLFKKSKVFTKHLL